MQNCRKKIAYYQSLLADENMCWASFVMKPWKSKQNMQTLTIQLVANPGEIDVEDLIEEETCVFTMSNLNYVKRTPLMTYKSQNRGGRGIMGMQTREEDFVKDLFLSSTHDTIYFTDHGRVYRKKGYEIPEAGRTARGTAIVNLIEIAPDETVTAVIPVKEFREDRYLVMLTKQGIIKKTDMANYANIRKGGLIAINLKEDDSLIGVMTTNGNDQILVATRNGMCIKFSETNVRPLGRAATSIGNTAERWRLCGFCWESDTKCKSIKCYRKRLWQTNTCGRIQRTTPWRYGCQSPSTDRKNWAFNRCFDVKRK